MRLFVAIMMSLATLLIQPSTNALTLQSSAGGPRVFCYTAYDSDFFYLAATISKPRLVGNQSKYFSDAVKDDCITVFIDTNPDSKAKVRSPRSVQMAVSAAGGVQLYRGATATPLSGFGDFLQGVDGSPKAFKIGLTRKGTVNGASASDNGFTVELAIPWIELGGAPTVGQKMRFNVASLTAESEGSGIYSISPALKSSADMQNPSLWSEIIFVDAPVKSVADAPNAKVCARLFSSKPLIDGIIDEAVWSTVTAFAFGADKSANPIGPVTPGLGAARVRITHPVKKAQPAILPLPFPAVNLPTTHIAQATPNLVFAKYVMNIQNDSRKALPIRSVRGPDGNVNLSNHPMDGSGPWYTYDRVDWHSRQLADMRQSGVDAALVVWRPIGPNDDVIFPQGLAAMRGALDHLWRTGQEYPQVGLQLDLSGLQEKASAFSANQVFGYIRTFYRSIPARYRASVELSEANSGLRGVVLTITGSTKKCPVSTDEITLFRKQFASEFGADLVILGRAEWAETLKTDGYLPASGGASTRWSEGGWIKTAVVSPGRDAVMGMTPADTGLARKDGQTYRSGWTEIGRRRPDWVIIDSWNNFVDGTAVAASLQNGLLYTDLTRLYSASLTSSSPGHACKVISFDSPNIFVSSSVTKALLRISNGTLGAITPEGHFFGLQWRKADGTAVGPLIRAPFPNIVGTGLSATVPVVLPVPREVGDYHLDGELFAVRLGKNEVQDPHQLVVSKLKIIAQDEVKKSQSIRVLRQDLPAGVESGGFYQVNAMLRNDSGFTWKASAGGTVMAHLWKTSLVNGESEPMDISDASVAITSDVLPGQTTNVTVPLLLANSSDAALIRTWTGTDNWIYEIRYEFQGMDAAAGSAVSPPEPIAVYDADFGVQITSDFTPGQLPGERRLPVKMSVKNFGSQTWLKDRVRVGY
ncbi:MAG: sugar-binding protein, partial [Chthonomonadales bacterium]